MHPRKILNFLLVCSYEKSQGKNCMDMQMKGYDLNLYERLGRVKMNILVISAQQFLLLSLNNLKLIEVSAGSECSLHSLKSREPNMQFHIVFYCCIVLSLIGRKTIAHSLGEETSFYYIMSSFSDHNNEYSFVFKSDMMCLRRSYNFLHLLYMFLIKSMNVCLWIRYTWISKDHLWFWSPFKNLKSPWEYKNHDRLLKVCSKHWFEKLVTISICSLHTWKGSQSLCSNTKIPVMADLFLGGLFNFTCAVWGREPS